MITKASCRRKSYFGFRVQKKREVQDGGKAWQQEVRGQIWEILLQQQKQGRENELYVGRRNSQCPSPLVYYLQWGSISFRLHHLRQHDQVGTNLLNTWTYWGYFSFRSTQSKTPCKLNVLLGKEHFCSFGDIDHPIHLWTQSTLYTVVWGDITQHTLYSGVRKYSWMKLTLVTWTIR